MVSCRWPDVLVWARGTARGCHVAERCGWSKSKQSQLEHGLLQLGADELVTLHRVLTELPGARVRAHAVTIDQLAELATWAATWSPPACPGWMHVRTHRVRSFAAAVAELRRAEDAPR